MSAVYVPWAALTKPHRITAAGSRYAFPPPEDHLERLAGVSLETAPPDGRLGARLACYYEHVRTAMAHGVLEITAGASKHLFLKTQLTSVPVPGVLPSFGLPARIEVPYLDIRIGNMAPTCDSFGVALEFVDLWPDEDGPPALWRDFKGEVYFALKYHGYARA